MQAYPANRHIRKHGPQGLEQYQSYKPWLRDEFTFRCVYCLERERWYPNGHHSFGVDHAKPKGRYKHLVCEYDNLLYACNRCNTAKASRELLDPTAVAMGEHCEVDLEGNIQGLTIEGRELIIALGLNSAAVTATRHRYIKISKLYAEFPNEQEVADLFHDVFGYPADIPNLHRCRAPGNSRPDGRDGSYFVLNSNKALEKVCSI